ncbi:MAG: hypothetical protein ACJ72N_07015 [Labedaea sp.]
MTAAGATQRPCPGGCGTHVHGEFISCGLCWDLLPADLRLRIANGDESTHTDAVAEAAAWFNTHTSPLRRYGHG